FNTVVSAAMKMLNGLQSENVQIAHYLDNEPAREKARANRAAVMYEGLSILLRVIAPITPHIAAELWRQLGFDGDIIDASWPEVDESALTQEEIELVLQINGKLRGNLRVAKNAGREMIELLASNHEQVRKFSAEGTIKRIVVVPGRLVNVVV
ncbi:MAG: class I tRNA ligase family protein, partial [Burkholderiales bacterium]